MVPFLLLMSFVQYYSKGSQFSLAKSLKDKNLLKLATKAGATQFLVQIFYLLSGQYTIISHATILSSLGGAIIVV